MNKENFTVTLSQKEIDFILYDTFNKNKKLSKDELNNIVVQYLSDCVRDNIEHFKLVTEYQEFLDTMII